MGSVEIQPSRGWALLCSSDQLSRVGTSHAESVARAGRANPGLRYLLVDHSAVTEEAIDTASLQELARRLRGDLVPLPEGLIAIVAPADVLFGLSRMYSMLGELDNLDVIVKRDRSEAIAWLREELTSRGLDFRPD